MPEILKILDGHTTKIKHKGRLIDVGVVIFRVSHNEAAPIDHIGYYNLMFRKNVLSALKYIHLVKPEETEEMVKLERKFEAQIGTRPDNSDPGVCVCGPMPPQGDETQLDVIPAAAGIQEEAHP
jgi:hypothetical protein